MQEGATEEQGWHAISLFAIIRLIVCLQTKLDFIFLFDQLLFYLTSYCIMCDINVEFEHYVGIMAPM